VGADLIPAHSYLLGAWVWAGFLGGVFWFATAALAVWLLAKLYSFRMEVAPLLVFSAMFFLWDIAFSPYGASARIIAPYELVLCLLGLRLMRENRDDRHPPDLAGQSRQPRASPSLTSLDEGTSSTIVVGPDSVQTAGAFERRAVPCCQLSSA
jgi:hypothetical protein